MAAIGIIEFLLERFGIGEVTVMHEHDAVGGAHIERLRFFVAVGRTLRRIAYLTNPTGARQVIHVARSENITNQAHAFELMEG